MPYTGGSWKQAFNPNLPIRLNCASEAERTQRVEDNTSRGFELISTHEYAQGGKHFEYTKYIAVMRRRNIKE